MITFESDYTEGAHPAVLAHLLETNLTQLPGYGSDEITARAKEKIRAACHAPESDVYFLVGGTQTNQVVISSLLTSCEGAIAADTGHIGLHEAGAIEVTGHKVLPLPAQEGKLDAKTVRAYLERFYADGNHEHMVFPGLVYISHPTEYGTLYTKAELTALHDVCQAFDIPLYLDGARLGYGLCSPGTDVTLPDLAALCDVFYIGGTKVGALCGEAVVFAKGKMPAHFLTLVKQRGALLAKGRLLGVQFDALFTDDLYFRISRHAIDMAMKIKALFREKGYPFFLDSPTNQQFIILENKQMEALEKVVGFSYWEPYDETHTVVRFASSWATTEEELSYLASVL